MPDVLAVQRVSPFDGLTREELVEKARLYRDEQIDGTSLYQNMMIMTLYDLMPCLIDEGIKRMIYRIQVVQNRVRSGKTSMYEPRLAETFE